MRLETDCEELRGVELRGVELRGVELLLGTANAGPGSMIGPEGLGSTMFRGEICVCDGASAAAFQVARSELGSRGVTRGLTWLPWY